MMGLLSEYHPHPQCIGRPTFLTYLFSPLAPISVTYIHPKPLAGAYIGREKGKTQVRGVSVVSVVSCVRILAGSPSGQTGAKGSSRVGLSDV